MDPPVIEPPVIEQGSLTECFARGVEGCLDGTDMCVLEGSTCVPALERLPGMSLSAEDRETAKVVIAALLPGADDETTEFTEGVQNVFGMMGHTIGVRVVELMTQGGHDSWLDIASHVARELTAELAEECPLCYETLHERDPPDGTDSRLLDHPRACCGRMYHRRCMAKWVTSKHRLGKEAMCPINPNVTLARDLLPARQEDREQHLSYLEERRQEWELGRTSYTEEERVFLGNDWLLQNQLAEQDDGRVAELWSLIEAHVGRNTALVGAYFEEIGQIRDDGVDRLLRFHGEAVANLIAHQPGQEDELRNFLSRVLDITVAETNMLRFHDEERLRFDESESLRLIALTRKVKVMVGKLTIFTFFVWLLTAIVHEYNIPFHGPIY